MADPILDPLREYVELVTQLTTIYADDPEPTAPRPSVDPAVPTYIAIGLDDDESMGSTSCEREQLKDPTDPSKGTERTFETVREGTLQIEIFGPGAGDYARALDIGRDRQDVNDILEAAGIALGSVTEVSDAPRIVGIEREPDVSLGAAVSWVQTMTIESTNYAAEVEHTTDLSEE